MPTFADPVRSPIPPPTARAAPTSARSKPVIAPIASSMITQMMPAITSDQLTQLPTKRLLLLHVPRTISSVRLVFTDSSCETVAGGIFESFFHWREGKTGFGEVSFSLFLCSGGLFFCFFLFLFFR